jgi:hypothetical protein
MAPHLEDTPRGATVDPQRLVQRTVKRGAVAAELSPELLLPLGLGERRRVASDPLHLGGVAGAGRRGLGAVPLAPPATMWPSRRLTRAPSSDSGESVELAH